MSMALNITIQSYDGHLEFGLVGCARAVDAISELAAGIEASFEALLAAHAVPPAAARPSRGAPRETTGATRRRKASA